MKKILLNSVGLATLLAIVALLNSCSEDTTDPRYVMWYPDTTEITYDYDEWEYKSYTEYLTGYTVLPIYMGYGALQLDVKYTSSGELNCGDWTWTSSDESVATVDQNGAVYPVGEGETIIEVAILPSESTNISCRDQIKITVDDKLTLAEEIKINAPTTTIYEGGFTFTLTAEVSKTASDPLKGNDATYNAFTWKSSNPGIATIDELTGVVKTSWIPITPTMSVEFWATTIDGSGVSDCIEIDIHEAIPVDSVKFTSKTLAMDGGYFARNWGTFTLEHDMYPEDATPGLIEWSSSNESVLTVSEGGVVKFTGEFGYDITITASCMNSDDEPKTITVSVPAGYFHEDFSTDKGDFTVDGGYDDLGAVRWMWGPQINSTNQSTDGGVQFDWKEGIDGQMFMQFITWTTGTVGSSQERGDLMCTQLDDMGLNSNFKYIVWHIDKVAEVYAEDSNYSSFAQSQNFDISDYTDGIRSFPGTKTTQFTTFDFDDLTQFIVMDITEVSNEGLTLSSYLTSSVSDEWIPYEFNMAHTNLGISKDGSPTRYNVYSIFSLPSDTNINSYIEEYKKTWVNPDPDRY